MKNLYRHFLTLCLLVVAGAVQAQTVEYIHTDALGSPVAVTNAAGAVIEQSEYEPFGALINRGNHDGPGYTGHVMDGATGLTYMQQRYYDPVVGAFLSVDPIATNATQGAGFNRYTYANENPYRFVDPDGRKGVAIPNTCSRVGGTACSGKFTLPSRMDRVPTLSETISHYRGGSGRSVQVPVDAIDPQGMAGGEQFERSPGILRAIKSIKKPEPGSSAPVRWTGKEDNVPYVTVPPQWAVLGTLTLKIEGDVKFNGTSWSFDGSYRFFDDIYNFDFDATRPVRSIATMGAGIYHGAGKDFYIEIRGSQPVNVQFREDFP